MTRRLFPLLLFAAACGPKTNATTVNSGETRDHRSFTYSENDGGWIHANRGTEFAAPLVNSQARLRVLRRREVAFKIHPRDLCRFTPIRTQGPVAIQVRGFTSLTSAHIACLRKWRPTHLSLHSVQVAGANLGQLPAAHLALVDIQDISPGQWQQIASIPQLRELRLSRTRQVPPRTWSRLVAQLHGLHTTTTKLPENFHESLVTAKRLTHLSLDVSLSSEAIGQLISLPLVELTLYKSQLTSEDVRQLAKLRSLRSLHIFTSARSNVDKQAFTLLSTHPSLRHLSLVGMAASHLVIGSHWESLRFTYDGLHRFPYLGDSQLRSLSITGLIDLRSLREIPLASQLETLHIHLREDSFDKGRAPLPRGLKQLTVRNLKLDERICNRLLRLSIQQLAVSGPDVSSCLGALTTLTALDVSGSRVTLTSLSQLNKLEQLRFASGRLRSDDLAVLKQLTRLSWLDLQFNTDITDDAIQHLVLLPNLRHVDLRHTSVTPEGAEKLRRALPQVAVLL